MRRGEYGNQFKGPAMSGGPARPGIGGMGGGTGGGYGGATTRPMPGGGGYGIRPQAEPAFATRPMPAPGPRPQGGGGGGYGMTTRPMPMPAPGPRPTPGGAGGHQMYPGGGFTVGPQGGGMGQQVYGQNPFMSFLMEMFKNMGGQGGGFGGFR